MEAHLLARHREILRKNDISFIVLRIGNNMFIVRFKVNKDEGLSGAPFFIGVIFIDARKLSRDCRLTSSGLLWSQFATAKDLNMSGASVSIHRVKVIMSSPSSSTSLVAVSCLMVYSPSKGVPFSNSSFFSLSSSS